TASPDPVSHTVNDFDLSTVAPRRAGPRRPQARVALKSAKSEFQKALTQMLAAPTKSKTSGGGTAVLQAPPAALAEVDHGAVVLAAITSCTNTSNPSVLLGAGLLAKKAVERGLKTQSWVKTSLAPGSQVVTAYLQKSGLLPYLEQLGFHVVGYGCTTCIGNSGPLPDDVTATVRERNLVVCSVLSGNRNFEGRIQQDVRANYLASPPLVVAYALAGRMTIDLSTEPLGTGKQGEPVYLRDLWPSQAEIQQAMGAVEASMYREKYATVSVGDTRWQALPVPEGEVYAWEADSTYIRNPPYFENMTLTPEPLQDVKGARVLAVLGDSVTTDHISPAGSIKVDSPAGKYLIAHGVTPADFNSYGARRGNHEVMMRGTFANIRLRNQLVPGVEGGFTTHMPSGEQMTIYDAAMRYKQEGVSLLILAGKEYGSGSSRDWAAKGTALLGVTVVIAESYERIHRSNLVNMGVLPLQFKPGANAASLKLTGREIFQIAGIAAGLKPRSDIQVTAVGESGPVTFTATVRIDTPEEVVSFSHGGILPYVVRQLVQSRG
ncbi:MAG: aconitate hydratase AcnA, partial [Vicinamibacterales bacterium]